MTDPADDSLDALLRDAFDGPVPADGFCERVMTQLPSRPRGYRAWPIAAGVTTGMAACVAGLGSVPTMRDGWQDWLALEPSPSTMLLLAIASGISLLAAVWALAEASASDARFGPFRS